MFSWEEIYIFSSAVVPATELGKRYNVAPTQMSPVVRLDEKGSRKGELLRWGLIPSWSKDIKIASSLINARAETVASKPSFRSAFKTRRCLVPVSGFYEWQKLGEGAKKQPYYIHARENTPLFFAGLWEHWHPQDQEAIESFTIITTNANAFMSELHDRMPVILSSEVFEQWLNPSTKSEELQILLKPCDNELLVRYKVSTLVNSARNESIECINQLVDQY